ncbi:hypothetical protein FO519_004304 [Halicephalobus sp. NKZ332]|nr:hypothetical protein FO519_004304 [Halicephalobus sp. NKZ332]
MTSRTTSHGPPPASSVDGDYFGGGNREREVDLGQLFSDVSKTVGKFRNILSNNSPQQSPGNFFEDMGQEKEDSTLLAKLFGTSSGVCFKTCGMEDIQFAARRAGEMFITMKICMIILTLVAVICFCALTCAILLYIYKNRHALRILSNQRNNSSDESTASVTPLIFSKRNPPIPTNTAPKPPAHQSSPTGSSIHHHVHTSSSD